MLAISEPHICLIAVVLASHLYPVLDNVSLQPPAIGWLHFLFVTLGLFDLSVFLVVTRALVCLIIAKKELELFLTLLSFVKLFKFIPLILDW